MKYYKETKIKSFAEIAEYFNEVHASNANLAIYFDAINTLRVFAENIDDLSCVISDKNAHETPSTDKHIKCCRCSDPDRNTEAQRIKRLEKLRERWGDEFNPEMVSTRNYKPHYYANMKSKTSGKSFRLNVRNKIVNKEMKGSFTSYGLSLNGSTVPLF